MAPSSRPDFVNGLVCGQPREVANAIGVRAALRTAPLIADKVGENPAEHSTDIVLPLSPATAAPWFAGKWPNQGAAIIDAAAFTAAAISRSAATATTFTAAADSDAAVWAAITVDAIAIESSNNAGEMIRLPL